MEQWEVRTEDFIDSYDREEAAKRAFGSAKKDINEEEEGWVELYHRDDVKSDWILIKRFYLNVKPPREVRSNK